MPFDPKQKPMMPDPREIAMAAARASDNEELAEQVLSGNMPARGAQPFLAGIIAGIVRDLVVPVIKVKNFKEFDYKDNPMRAELTLANDEKVVVWIEAIPK